MMDYRDPGTTAEYCDGLAPEPEDEMATKRWIQFEDVKQLMEDLADLVEDARTAGRGPGHLIAALANTLGHVITRVRDIDEAQSLANQAKCAIDDSVQQRKRRQTGVGHVAGDAD